MEEKNKILLEQKLSEFEKLEDNLVFKVLVIDDDKNILKLIQKYLESLRFQVLTTDNPYTGISIAVKQNPSIIILDIFIPDLGGEKILKILKSIDITSNIPIIILSANLSKDLLNSTYKDGAAAFLAKPFTRDDLIKNIRKILEPVLNNNVSYNKSIK